MSANAQPAPLNIAAPTRLWVGLFLLARLVMVLSTPLAGLRGFGDLPNFFQQAALPGWPYLDYWSEFPPVFPFLSTLLYRAAAGQEHVYDYLLIAVLTLADAGNLAIFHRLANRLHGPVAGQARVLVYVLILVALPYQWWYFDPLAVFFLLLSFDWITQGKDRLAALAVTVGGLVKLFPMLALAWIWRISWPRRAALLTLLVVALVAGAYALLAFVSPGYTLAGLRSQGSKGSWETVWALLDGNHATGNFGPYAERLDPAAASQPRGNPARVPPLASLAAFGALGLVLLLKVKRMDARGGLALVGMAFCLMWLWSPGWSVQWCLYLLPLILLVFAERLALLLGATFLLVNLLEWPVLLSRGAFDALAGPVLLRTALLALMAVLFYRQARAGEVAAHA